MVETASSYTSVDIRNMLQLLFLIIWAIPSCLGGVTCSISQGSTTITAYCETSCCSSKCCTESEEEGISTVAIVMSVLIAVIVILFIIALVIISYRKKKPSCCYPHSKKEEYDDKEKVLVGEGNNTENMMDQENKKKDRSGDECSSGYSSSLSVKSVNNNNTSRRAPVARPASPFNAGGSPILSRLVAPAMSIPRSTAMPPPAGHGFANLAFDKSGDKTEILNMKKHKPPGPKTVTFNNKVDSPRGSITSLPSAEKNKPHYPPILPPLYKYEKTLSDLFLSDQHKSTNSPTEKTPNGHGHNKLHRKSYPADNKIGFMWDDNEVKPKSTILKTMSPSSQATSGQNATSTNSPARSQSIINTFEIVQTRKKASSRRRDIQNYNSSESAYVPTIVQAADSRDSVDSIELDENKESKNAQRHNSLISPYLATPYTISKRRSLGTSGFSSPPANSSPSASRSGDVSNKSSGEIANGSSTYVSSFMRQRADAATSDSPV